MRIKRSVLLLSMALLACRQAQVEVPGPIGRDAYEARLAREGGMPLPAPDLIVLAESACLQIESELDRLAEELSPGRGWRQLFTELAKQHPADTGDLLERYRQEIDQAAAFVAAEGLVTLPPKPPRVVEVGNIAFRQHFPLALYLEGQLAVTTTAGREPDPDYLANHCEICIAPLAVHEAYPGHHVGFFHLDQSELQQDYPDGVADRLLEPVRNKFLIEGWGLYAELLMLEHGYYEGDPGAAIGAWRMLLLRALRAKIDAQLHSGDLDAETAVSIYEQRLGMSRDAAATEVRRHLLEATMKASYFVGLLEILELRREVRRQSPSMTDREFHDRLIRWSLRIPDIARVSFGIELAPLDVAKDQLVVGASTGVAEASRDARRLPS